MQRIQPVETCNCFPQNMSSRMLVHHLSAGLETCLVVVRSERTKRKERKKKKKEKKGEKEIRVVVERFGCVQNRPDRNIFTICEGSLRQKMASVKKNVSACNNFIPKPKNTC